MKTLNKPRIAVIGLKGLPAFGGAAAVGENIIEQLKDRYDFTVLSVASHTSKENTNINGVKQVVFRNFGKGGLNTFIYYWQCFFYAFFRKYDLIHLHHAGSGYITPFLRLRYKVIVTLHGVHSYIDPKFSKTHNSFFRFSERLNMLSANEIASVSKPDAEYVRKKYNRSVSYVPNGISHKDLPSLKDKQQQDYILFAAGRIYEIKGFHLLLEAMQMCSISDLLKVAGNINQVSYYQKRIEELAKGLNIEFLGLIKEKSELMSLVANAKFFVFPSLSEAMSMMLLEVVSMKVPVIASDIPSNRAVFSDKEVLFFKSNDSIDLSEKIKFALNNPEIMKSNADRAFQKLITEYTWETIAKKYDDFYCKLLKR